MEIRDRRLDQIPEEPKILPRSPAPSMSYAGVGKIDRPRFFPDSSAQIHILKIHKISVVEASYLVKQAFAKKHKTAGNKRHIENRLIICVFHFQPV
jgi:hypothetical protein